jgi:hypothetical protein
MMPDAQRMERTTSGTTWISARIAIHARAKLAARQQAQRSLCVDWTKVKIARASVLLWVASGRVESGSSTMSIAVATDGKRSLERPPFSN